MAFDVYVGSFTRFYRREWENVVQKMAREQGSEYKMIYAGGPPPPPQPAAEIREAVRTWCADMQRVLGSNVPHSIEWDESENSPYFTDRPGWEGFRGLLLLAAYEDHPDLSPPEELPEEWASNEAFIRSTAKGFRPKYPQILMGELWLPLEVRFYFEGATLTSEKQRIGSVYELRRQLEELKAATVPKLAAARGPTDVEKETLLEAGRAGMEVFLRMATLACEHRLPLLLSF
jgi:hypothetical protein